jgi:hypothetical protein
MSWMATTYANTRDNIYDIWIGTQAVPIAVPVSYHPGDWWDEGTEERRDGEANLLLFLRSPFPCSSACPELCRRVEGEALW